MATHQMRFPSSLEGSLPIAGNPRPSCARLYPSSSAQILSPCPSGHWAVLPYSLRNRKRSRLLSSRLICGPSLRGPTEKALARIASRCEPVSMAQLAFNAHDACSDAFRQAWFQIFVSDSSAVPLVCTKLISPLAKASSRSRARNHPIRKILAYFGFGQNGKDRIAGIDGSALARVPAPSIRRTSACGEERRRESRDNGPDKLPE